MLADIIEKWGGSPEKPLDLYSDVFRLGEGAIQREWEEPGEFKSNPIIIGHDGERMHRKIMFEDTFEGTLEEFCGYDWAFMSGCTYFGRSNSAERQGKLYALIFDIDGVDDSKLNNFFSGAIRGGAYPVPQHVVLSGHGVHLYYVLEEPLDLFPNLKSQVKELKYALTRNLWNRYTSTVEEVQYQGINQAFRVPGSKTKDDAQIPVCAAYRLNQHRTSIEELNDFVLKESKVDLSARYGPTRHTLEQAKELFPEWYERVIVEGGGRRQWVVKCDLYDWWLRRISGDEVAYGHRYFCIMMLAIFAVKCGICDREKVRADALSLIPYFTDINPAHPFTEADVDSALDCLDARYATFPRKDVEKLSGIGVPANKRNGRKQEVHLAGARAIQEINDKFNGTNWRDGNGRKSKRDMVRKYAAEHPEANHSQIARALGVSRPTVIKWLKQ